MLSFWEKQSFTAYDYIVIGSGIVGLSTAISLKERNPDCTVLILEKGLLPTGASTKNAGFACFGSPTELLEDIKIMGKDKALDLVNERFSGLLKLRERLGDERIGYINHGGYELIRQQEAYCLDELEVLNDWLKDLFDREPFVEDKSLARQFGFNTDLIQSVVYSRYEAQIDTGLMMKNLIRLANHLGITIMTGAHVASLDDAGTTVRVVVKDSSNNDLVFSASSVAVCTNAFTKQLIPTLDINPGRGIVLVTKPIPNLKFKGVFHCEKGYYYFRNYEDRVIFGGGRNLDYQTETTTVFEINEMIKKELIRQLNEVILPGTPYEIDQIWAGIMAFGENKQPILKKHSPNVYLGVRLGGMGVAIGSKMGEKLAEMMI